MSWLEKIWEAQSKIKAVELELWDKASALRKIGLSSLSEEMYNYANALDEALKLLTETSYKKVDDDLNNARLNTKSIMEMALMTIEAKAGIEK